MVSLAIKSRSRAIKSFQAKLDGGRSLDSSTVHELKLIVKKNTKLDPARQRLTTANKKLLDDDEKPLSYYGIGNEDEVVLKDLGPQISWRTVFLIEYLGPLLIHPLLYFSSPISNMIYNGPVAHSSMQTAAFVLVMAHYVKRELETIFVHRFSHATMPLINIFKNSFHYWILSGILLGLPIYGRNFSSLALRNTLFDSPLWLYSCIGLWSYAEVSNLAVHLHLRSLRPPGTRTRVLPHGYGFNLVHCPNYLFEALGWLAFTGLTGSWASALFLSVSTAQMTIWALKKAKNYRKEFGDQVPKGRKAMFPFLL